MEGFGPQRPIWRLISDHSQGSRLLKLRRLSTGSIAILAADYGSSEVFSLYLLLRIFESWNLPTFPHIIKLERHIFLKPTSKK
ncbi:uncharacterized protein EAF01_002410 [Botrytis porri]|uniref:uncharacterized protein n=1 Tax=Botrytis porri TaxID=87229 RepID=UPI00190265B1|nr:uncharacterized protein EAF01_002410 [Botrytis porri]KAF7910901.1 hypothetical protein EAF01_002410 [Botrytis porri]